MNIKWQESLPPSNPTGFPSKWRIVADELQKRPGVWALILEDVTKSTAQSCRVQLKHYGCEVTQRKSDTGVDVYARWPESV